MNNSLFIKTKELLNSLIMTLTICEMSLNLVRAYISTKSTMDMKPNQNLYSIKLLNLHLEVPCKVIIIISLLNSLTAKTNQYLILH